MKFKSHPDTCACCEGLEILTPLPVANRPGLPALTYRMGTHASFLESMLARLSSFYLEVDGKGVPIPWNGLSAGCGPDDRARPDDPCAPASWPRLYPLRALTTRRSEDPAIALLDAWAIVADVLTFYQERIANEGFLRTALERRSIQELARLVGYRLRPGVAASVYLAFELDKDYQVEIPVGTRAQSMPQPGELPQPFETSEALAARYAWNAIPARGQRPQYIALGNAYEIDKVYLEGLATRLKPNDPLLFVFSEGAGDQAARFVKSIEPVVVIEPVPGAGYTVVELQPVSEIVYAQRIAARHLDPTTFSVDPTTLTVRNLLPILNKLAQVRNRRALEGELPTALKLAKIRPSAAGDELLNWLESLEADLQKLSTRLAQAQVAAVVNPLAGSMSPFPFLDQVPAQVKEPARRFASGRDLPRDLTAILASGADAVPRMLTVLKPRMAETFYAAWGSAQTTPNSPLQQVAALRVKAAPFGHNAGPMPILDNAGALVGETEWPLADGVVFQVTLPVERSIPVFNLALAAAPAQGRAKITVKAGGQTQYGSIDLSEGAVLELPNARVTAETIDDEISRFVFEFAPLDIVRTIQFELSGGQVLVSVDDAQVADLAEGQTTVVQPALGRRVSAFYSQSGVGAIDEALVPPAQRNVLTLDAAYDQIIPESWVLIDRPSWPQPLAFQVQQVDTISETAYRLSGKATRLVLSGDWLAADDLLLSDIRSTTVYAQSESLPQTDERWEDPVQGNTIELDGLYDGLASGRWLLVTGERIDIPGASGVKDVELAMIANVTQGVQMVPAADGSGDIPRPGDRAHTVLELAQPLDNTYARQTVKVYANVTRATHGETRREVLGSGDARKAFQSFLLRQSPLTYLPAPTPQGAESTLEVLVNEVRWPEVDNLYFQGKSDRGYELRRDDDGQKDLTTVVFGDGRHGARLPTGSENIEALYRSGLGKVGNVAAESIKMLVIRPLGVRGVNNPQRASGGADRDDRDSARRNAPLAVMALDRLVSAQDYEDFARMFAGIGKAAAQVFPQARGQLVHVTIAGAANIPIDVNSDLYRNLNLAFQRYGDPSQPFEIDVRELLLLIVSAKVRLLPDYRWESVEPQIRRALLEAFGFERRQLGQDVYASEIIAAIQHVAGVAFVDLDYLDSLSEEEALDENRLAAKLPAALPDRPKQGIDILYARPGAGLDILPAQLAILSPEIPDMLVLTELT